MQVRTRPDSSARASLQRMPCPSHRNHIPDSSTFPTVYSLPRNAAVMSWTHMASFQLWACSTHRAAMSLTSSSLRVLRSCRSSSPADLCGIRGAPHCVQGTSRPPSSHAWNTRLGYKRPALSTLTSHGNCICLMSRTEHHGRGGLEARHLLPLRPGRDILTL